MKIIAVTPGKPNNFTVKEISSKTVQISWLGPVVASVEPFKLLSIILRQGKVIIYNRILQDVDKEHKNNFMFKNLAPFTKYSGVVRLGNDNGFGEQVNFMFNTAEAGMKIFYDTAIVLDCIIVENYVYHHISPYSLAVKRKNTTIDNHYQSRTTIIIFSFYFSTRRPSTEFNDQSRTFIIIKCHVGTS